MPESEESFDGNYTCSITEEGRRLRVTNVCLAHTKWVTNRNADNETLSSETPWRLLLPRALGIDRTKLATTWDSSLKYPSRNLIVLHCSASQVIARPSAIKG